MEKLSANEKRRLKEVMSHERVLRGSWANADSMKVTTDRLIERGLLELRGRKIAKTGRLVHAGEVRITEAGRAALAALSR